MPGVALALLNGLALAAATEHFWLSHFSYTDPDVNQLPNRTYATLQLAANQTLLMQSFARDKLPGMINLQKSVWGAQLYTPTPAGWRLAASWRGVARQIVATLTPLSGYHGGPITHVMLGDELVMGGLPLAQLGALADMLHAELGKIGVYIYTNDAFATGLPCSSNATCSAWSLGSSGAGNATCQRGYCYAAAWPYLPPGLDFISLDAYSEGAREVAVVREMHQRYFFPVLQPHQKLVLVPGMFGPIAARGDASAMAAADESNVEKLQAYWKYAQEDSRIGGMVEWHWNDLETAFQPSTMTLGLQSFPRTLKLCAQIVQEVNENVARMPSPPPINALPAPPGLPLPQGFHQLDCCIRQEALYFGLQRVSNAGAGALLDVAAAKTSSAASLSAALRLSGCDVDQCPARADTVGKRGSNPPSTSRDAGTRNLRIEVHVSPDGCDDNPGNTSHPLQTLQAAALAMREKRNSHEARRLPAAVVLHSGTYRLSVTLELKPEDGGTSAEASVAWVAAEGARVRITGSQSLDGMNLTWKAAPTAAGVARGTLVARLPAGTAAIDSLYQHGERLTRARYPDVRGSPDTPMAQCTQQPEVPAVEGCCDAACGMPNTQLPPFRQVSTPRGCVE